MGLVCLTPQEGKKIRSVDYQWQMEHLPPVLDPNDPLSVPYHGGEYDNGNFAEFPTRKDFDVEALQKGRLGVKSKKEAAAFLQAWLYFGLLQETLQVPFQMADFVRENESGQQLVTTAKLRGYLHIWKAGHESSKEDPAQLEARRVRVAECLENSYGVWYNFGEGVLAEIVGNEVELSIQLLASALEHAFLSVSKRALGQPWAAWIEDADTPWRRAPRSKFLRSRLLSHGWCPSLYSNRIFDLPMQYFVSLFGPPSRRNHEECTDEDSTCKKLNVSKAEYKTLHVEESCSCQLLKPHMEEVSEIIDNGGIPVLYLDESDEGVKLKVVPHCRGIEYTAISHVSVQVVFIIS